MMRELLLLRHGKSDWSNDGSDFDRPLNSRGQRDAARIGRWLADQRLLPDSVFSSPASRAAQTAKLVCANAGIEAADIVWVEGLYLASVGTLLELVRAIPAERRRILLIGHNPGLEDLVEHLSGTAEQLRRQGKLLTTAALALLALKNDWSQLGRNSAELRQIVRARALDDA